LNVRCHGRLVAGRAVSGSIFDGRPGIWLDSNRLYFLRRIGQDYEFVSPYHPSLRAMPGLFSRHRRRSAA